MNEQLSGDSNLPGRAGMICDFCLKPNPEWDYPCAPYSEDPTGDGWAACQDCYKLVEAGNIHDLIRRVMTSPYAVGTKLPHSLLRSGDQAYRQYVVLYQGFFANRSGALRARD